MRGKQRILFLCTGNSARSQMAEAILREAGDNKYIVYSAGTDPKGIDPRTIVVMNEAGLDISTQTSKDIDFFVGQQFDYIITLCDRARERCPAFPGATSINWSFEDPAEASGNRDMQLKKFRKVRDEITRRIRLWMLAAKTDR